MPFFHSELTNARHRDISRRSFSSLSSSSCSSSDHAYAVHLTDETSSMQPPQHPSAAKISLAHQHLKNETEIKTEPRPHSPLAYTPTTLLEKDPEGPSILTTTQSPEHAEYLEDVPVIGQIYRWLSSCQGERGEEEEEEEERSNTLSSDDDPSQTPNSEHTSPGINPYCNGHVEGYPPVSRYQTHFQLPSNESIQGDVMNLTTLVNDTARRANNLSNRHEPHDSRPTDSRPTPLTRQLTLTWSDHQFPSSPSSYASPPSTSASPLSSPSLFTPAHRRPRKSLTRSFRDAESRGEKEFWSLVRSGAEAGDLGALWVEKTARFAKDFTSRL